MKKRGFSALLALISFLLIVLLSGQKPLEPEKESAKALLMEGKKKWDVGDFDSAYILFRLSQIAATQVLDPQAQAEATYRSGLYLARQMQLSTAALTLDSAIVMAKRLDSLSAMFFFARRERAFVALNQGQIPEAIGRYEDILTDLQPLPPAADSIRGLVKESLGQAYFYQGNFEAGLQASQEALALYQGIFHPQHVKIGICANTLGIMYMYLDRFPESIAHFEQAVAIFNQKYPPAHPNVLQIQTNLGVLYGELGLFWKSLRVHQQVYKQKEVLETRPHLNALLNLGATLIAVGDYQAALLYFDQADAFLQKNTELRAEHIPYIAQNRSTIYQQLGQQEKALTEIEKALQKNRELHGEGHPELLTDYLQWGDLLMAKKSFPEADEAFEKALQIAQKQIGAHSLQGGHALSYLGRLARMQGKYSLAEARFDQALDNYSAIENTFELADTYREMAINFRLQGKRDSCMHMHRQAWTMLLPELPFQLAPPAEIRAFWAFHPLEDMMFEQGESLRAFAKSPEELQAALACYEAALAVIDSQRHYYESPESRQVRLGDQLPIYEAALSCCQDLYQESREISYLERAFQLAEKSKANDLRDHLRAVQALHFAGLPDSLLEQERYFRQRIAAVNESRLSPQTDSAKRVALQQEAFDLQDQFRSFIHQLEQDFPAYHALKYASPDIFLQHVFAHLDPQKAMYSYFWGEKQLFIFRLFQQKIACSSLATADVSPLLKSWTDAISHPPPAEAFSMEELAAQAFELKQLLLPNFSVEMEKLAILANGQLGYLPFESLLREKGAGNDFRSWAFLGNDCALTYAPAAEIWLSQQMASSATSQYLGFAPEFGAGESSGSRAALSPLLHNQTEITDVAKLLKGKAMIGAAASEHSLKRLDSKVYILHFATHALADESQLMQSRLFLQQNKDSTEDGILHAFEIYGMQLNSPLCVLSACHTAQGPLQRGEGIMSLARAFQYSGCERVLSTLWQTDDRSGAAISQTFFEKLAEGKDVAIALQLARKAWLSQADSYHAHPYFWAQYVLIGDGGKIPIAKNRYWIWVLLFSTILLSLAWYVRRKK